MSTTARLACAAYVRTSTDDQQSPEDSKRWQLDTARRLVRAAGGVIVAVYHDVDVTRERPWARRPEAARLLGDAARPDRGWTALVIAEPQRAFSGGQFQLVFPQLTHYGVELWVPELGGRIDPDSLLQDAERETRARLYQTLDLELLLDPVGDPPTLELRLQLCGGGGRI